LAIPVANSAAFCGSGITVRSPPCTCLSSCQTEFNISTLTKNASTSVDQMERFYARNMPLSMER
jgi:hypothetical protein